MRMMLALLLAMASLPAYSQTAPSATTAAGYGIAGKVVNATTGEPVRRATVAVQDEEGSHAIASVETDNEGRFSLSGLAAGKYPLNASKRGFLTSYYDERDGYNTAIVTGEGQNTGEIVFRLTPRAVLHGVVRDDGGDPVEKASVMLFLKPHGHNPGDRITQVNTTTTDDTGAYEFGNLAEGEYLLAVTAKPWYALHKSTAAGLETQLSDAAAALDVVYPVTFFDSTTDEGSATGIPLTAGSRSEANINLHAAPALRLSVMDSTSAGGQVNNVRLEQSIFGLKIPATAEIVSDPRRMENSEFGGVVPGHYVMEQGIAEREMELEVSSSQQIDLAALSAPTAVVSGSVSGSPGTTLPEGLALILDSPDSAHPMGPYQTQSNQGNFRFPFVSPGNWELQVYSPGKNNSPQAMPVVSIATGGKTHSGNQIIVADKPLSLIVTVSDSETRIDGFARKDGKGKAGAMIVLVPMEPAALRVLSRRDQSDSDGSFSLYDVAPGEYTIVAIEDGWELDWARPEVIARYLAKGVAVTVTEKSGKVMKLSKPVPVQPR